MKSLLGITRRPDITFGKDGRISITSRVAKLLVMEEGDVIDIMQNKGEYLLYVRLKADEVVGRNEGVVHSSHKRKCFSHHFRASSRKLADAMRDAAGWTDDEPLRLSVGECDAFETIGLAVPIITRRPLKREEKT